ncbi:stearoyl-CoA desaturase [Spinellus fusiger]|nr:stearoyl-CoA desaturase [Spinellus fusiger]
MSVKEIPVFTCTKTESPKQPLPKTQVPPLFDSPTTWTNWYKRVRWVYAIILFVFPLASIYGMFTTELVKNTVILSVALYLFTGMGITAGYHRLWAHKSYQATPVLKFLLALCGGAAVQGSIYWWARDHRSHHRWTDTDRDPYNARRGFLYSHIGWLYFNRGIGKTGYADITDFKADKYIMLQNKFYPLIVAVTSLLIPACIAHYGWNDLRGGFYYAFLLRVTLVHHATFFVNSLAHFLGDHTYDDHHSPRDHWMTALVTFGEGYHNFHHQFPQDYRNAIMYYQYDPTKWLIRAFEFLGLAYDLKTFPTNEIIKGHVQMQEKKLAQVKSGIKYGTPIQDLPVYTWEEYQKLTLVEGKMWVLIEGILYDLEGFDHPGGAKYITASYGKDVTTSFNGGIYNHSNGARNLLAMMRVGVLLNGMEIMTDNDDNAHDTFKKTI